MSGNRERIAGWLEQAGVGGSIRDSGDGNLVSRCPFHKNKTGTSFAIRTDNGLFICYSAGCGVTGNLVNFLTSALGWRYQKARDAAERYGVPSLDDPAVYTLPDYGKRKMVDAEVSDYAVTEGHLGLYDFCPSYMLDRGFKRSVLREWSIGYDYGSRRVTIPVRDYQGKLVGISKRATHDYQQPKYLHLGFKKGSYLYGMHRVPAGADVVVTEGQLDAVAWSQMYLSPFPLSTMGALVTNRQITWLARHCNSVLLAFDNDRDGVAATLRVGDALLPRMRAGHVKALISWPSGVKDACDVLEASDVVKQKLFSSAVDYGRARLVLHGLLM